MIALSEKQWKVVLIVGAATGLIFIALFLWAYSDRGRKETEIIGNIGVEDGKANVKEQIANEKAVTTNQALGNLGNSVNRDSSTFNGSGASDRFCRDFPDDSSCKH